MKCAIITWLVDNERIAECIVDIVGDIVDIVVDSFVSLEPDREPFLLALLGSTVVGHGEWDVNRPFLVLVAYLSSKFEKKSVDFFI